MTAPLSPYIVLGLPFGARPEAAREAYEHLLAQPSRAWSDEDLRGALEDIDGCGENPALRLDWYRVPIDPACFDPPPGEGLFRPPPVPLARRTGPAAPAERQALARQATTDAVHLVAAEVGATLGLPPLYPS